MKGTRFKRKGHHEQYTVMAIREHDILCYGGSVNPWGKRGTKSFPLDGEYVILEEVDA